MIDKYYALTVLLEKDTRSDDAQPILDAIKMIKGVLSVKPELSNLETYSAHQRAKIEIVEKPLKVLS